MKGLKEYITEQLTSRQSRFDKFDSLEDDEFLIEGLQLDYKNKIVKLDDSDNGVVFLRKPLEYHYKSMNIISIFKRTKFNSELNNRNPDGNPFIYALKGKFGWKLDMTISDVKKYMKIFIENCKSIKKKYDTCIMIPSKSSVNELFMKELKKNIDCKDYINKFFEKMPTDEVLMNGIDYHKIDKENDEVNAKSIVKRIKKAIDDMGDYFEAKKIHKELLQYIKYITYDEENSEIREKIDGKDVLILDDIISSGESVSQAVEALKSGFEPKSITVITLLSKKF